MQNDPDIAVTNDRSEILTWLSPLEPHLRHHTIRTSRVKDVGDWLLHTKEFRSWRNGDGQGGSQKATLFCSGNLGVGKTHISSLVVDTLCDEPGEAEEDISVACFYFDSAAQKEQSAASVLGALLKQVAGSFKKIPQEITDAFQRHKKFIGGRELQLPKIAKMLGSLSFLQPTFLCLDALDECAAPDRADILLSLKDIIKTSSTTRVFLTGRPHVGGEVGKHFPERTTQVPISPRNGDIIRYIHKKLAQDTNSGEMDEELEAEIVKKIPETVSEIFLLVSPILDAVLRETTIYWRRERLQVMTDGPALEHAYGPTLERIKRQGSQQSRLGMTALMWICHSERPLGAPGLCEALSVEIGSTDYNGNNIPTIQTVLSCCQGLVVVDKEVLTVRLVHYTLREYLASHLNIFQSPHSTIAETCLAYLNSQQIMALSGSRVPNIQHLPFLEYSSLYWGVHMKNGLTDRGIALSLKLFSRYKHHISIRLLVEHALPFCYFPFIGRFSRFTGLHCASMFGLVEVVRALIIMDGVDINCIDGVGATPLLWAAVTGNEAAVELLLGREDVNPDRPDIYGRTPISWAAVNGHEAVVRLLLKRKDVNPEKPTRYDRTPISLAAENGHEVVVKLLLEREDINPDTRDCDGQTPISWAAGNGHEAVVKLLLGRKDVTPDRPDKYGQTPISWAAMNGHGVVVKLLQEQEDVSPDRPDI